MSSSKKHINEEVEKTLHALDDLKSARADDFFYSRLTARMEHRAKEEQQQKKPDLGFALSIAAVFMLMILNLAFISFYPDASDSRLNREEAVDELATEYTVSVSDLNYYEYFEEE